MTAKLACRITSRTITEREHAVHALLADGKSSKEIGSALGVKETTVKSHLKSIFGKLHVTSRTQAVSVAIRRGLVR